MQYSKTELKDPMKPEQPISPVKQFMFRQALHPDSQRNQKQMQGTRWVPYIAIGDQPGFRSCLLTIRPTMFCGRCQMMHNNGSCVACHRHFRHRNGRKMGKIAPPPPCIRLQEPSAPLPSSKEAHIKESRKRLYNPSPSSPRRKRIAQLH